MGALCFLRAIGWVDEYGIGDQCALLQRSANNLKHQNPAAPSALSGFWRYGASS